MCILHIDCGINKMDNKYLYKCLDRMEKPDLAIIKTKAAVSPRGETAAFATIGLGFIKKL